MVKLNLNIKMNKEARRQIVAIATQKGRMMMKKQIVEIISKGKECQTLKSRSQVLTELEGIIGDIK